ncbi:MAG: PIN domain protein [Planctomycetes bacterium]|jgi:predicted nucleic acid-binding protein|nr:PIN domain protein [Planctomycetota bacterium]
MRRLRVYIDTSVVGGCLDEEFQESSKALLDRARHGELTLLVSSLLLDELLEAPPAVQQVLLDLPETSIQMVELDEEADRLAREYLEADVLPETSLDDARHVAIASVNDADVVVSWNFRHIVQYRRIVGFNAANLRTGYRTIEIRSPREMVEP